MGLNVQKIFRNSNGGGIGMPGLLLAVLLVLLAVPLNAANGHSAGGKAGLFLSLVDHRLTLDARQVPLRDLLKELSKQSGYTFTGDGAQVLDPISLTLSDFPLEDAIGRILENYSFIKLSGGGNGRPGIIRVMGASRGAAIPAPAPPVAAPGQGELPFSNLTLEELKDRQVDSD